MPKYPNVNVNLIGEDGNAFSILGRATSAARTAGLSKDEIDAYQKEAMSNDYDHLLRTTMEWFTCDDQFGEHEDWDFDDEEDE